MADLLDQIHAQQQSQPAGGGDLLDQVHAQSYGPQQQGSFLHEAIVNPARQVASGAVGASAMANKLFANTFDLLDKAADHIAKATGTEKGGVFRAIADYTRKSQQEQEQKAQELSGGRQDFMSQVYRGGAQGALELPQYAVASELGGPVAGMGAISALGEADKGPVEALKAGAQGALTGGAMKVLGPGSRLLRGSTMAAGTGASALLQGADPKTALAQATTMGGMAAMGPGGATVKEAAGALRDAALETGGKVASKIATKIAGPGLNPVQQGAVDYVRSEGVPLRAGTQTGNRALQAFEATTASSPLGAQQAAEFNRGTEEGLQGLGGKLAGQAHAEPATPESVGKAIPAKLQKTIDNLSLERDDAYDKAWQARDDPQHTHQVPVRMVQGDEVAPGTGIYDQKPVMKSVNMPVDVRDIKSQAQPIFDEMQWMPMAERSASKAYMALERILQGDDFIPAWQAERGLSGLKEAARTTTRSGVRDAGQGVAASLIKNLQGRIDEAVARTGDDAIAGLQKGRATHAKVMDVADLADQLRDEPVQNFGKLTQQRDTGAGFLRQIADQAPEHMPALGRAWIQRQLDTATQGGGFAKTTGILNNWNKLGDATKQIMFPDPEVRASIGKLFQAADMWSRQPNPSGTEIVRQATSLNPARWLQGYIGGKLFYTPEGIKLLTDAIKPQSPGSQALNMAKVKAAAGRQGPPEPPPEQGGPQTPPPAPGGPGGPGGPGAGPSPAAPGFDNPANEYQYTTPEGIPVYKAPTTPGGSPGEPAPGSGEAKLRSALEKGKEFWKDEEGTQWVYRPGKTKLTDIPEQPPIPQQGTKLVVDDVAQYLNDRVAKSLGPVQPIASAATKLKRIIKLGRYELDDQLQKPAEESGIEWYDGDTKRADAHMAQAFPELSTNPIKRTLQKAISAVMSNNSNPRAEANYGAQIYDQYRQNGQIPLRNPANGKEWPAQGATIQLQKIQQMINKLGEQGFVDFLRSPQTIARIREFRPGAEGPAASVAPGSVVLGPKIGRYFYDVLGLPQEGSTVDMWDVRGQMRRLGRMFDGNGKLIEVPTPESDRQIFMDQHAKLGDEYGLTRKQAQSALWHYEQDLYRRLGLNVKSYRRSQGTEDFLRLKGLDPGDAK